MDTFGAFGAPAQQNFYGYGQQPAYGAYGGFPYAAQQPAQPPIFKQLLSADEVAKLKKNPNTFSTKLSEDEYLRALCTHKDRETNRITLEKLPNGKHRCSVCQAEFFLLDLNTTKEEIESTCNNFYDLMQSIKTYYGDVPDAMRDFYLMVGFIPKITQLFQISKTYFDKVTGNYGGLGMGNDQSGFAILSNIFGGGAMGGIAPGVGMGAPGGYYNQWGYGAPPAPAWGQPQQPPMGPQPAGWYNGAPVPQAAAMQTPMGAPVGYPGSPQPAPQYGFNPQNVAAPAPTVPMGSPNPIGYVDPNAAAQAQAVNAQSTTQPQPPMPPAPPANPNIEKANVNKTFAG